MVFPCCPSMLRTINMLPACCTKYGEENRNEPSYLRTYNRFSHATPCLKTHVAGEYTNTHAASSFDVVDPDVNNTGRSARLLVDTSSRDAQASHSSSSSSFCIGRRRKKLSLNPAKSCGGRVAQWPATRCSSCRCRFLVCAQIKQRQLV